MNYKTKAFTLVELMIVVAIVGILGAIAYPSYAEYIDKSKRAEAMAAILSASQAMERYKVNNYSYDMTSDITTVFTNKVPVEGGTPYYTLSLSTNTSTTYTILATPEGSMSGKKTLSLSHSGEKKWGASTYWPN